MKKIFLIVSLFFIANITQAQFYGAVANYKLVDGANWVKAKNYYLLTLIESDKQVQSLLNGDKELATLARAKKEALQNAMKTCKDGLCIPPVLTLSNDEIDLVGRRLSALYKTGNALDKLVKQHLIPSGCYNLYKDETPANLLVKAWQQDASAVNFTISVYAEGKKPNYPQIDSISFDVNKKSYYTLMYDAATEVADATESSNLFFAAPLHAALTYLEINERNNAGYYEPMYAGLNKPAVQKMKTVKWAAFPYSHIVVPGAGPDNLTTPLSGEGMLRCRFAAREYFAGKAPFVVVSGGSVHPFKTKNDEAVEMRRYMINTLHVPASAVIIEPHARHTTTNLRNDARLVFRYGMPFAKPGLIVTDKYQNDFIEKMDKRCLQELKYLPYKLGRRLSETSLEFYPSIGSLQIDADEPMDP